MENITGENIKWETSTVLRSLKYCCASSAMFHFDNIIVLGDIVVCTAHRNFNLVHDINVFQVQKKSSTFRANEVRGPSRKTLM